MTKPESDTTKAPGLCTAAQAAQWRAKTQDDARFDECLAEVYAHACGEVEGVFGPDSMMWRICGEPALFLGGLRALILQLAHPAVAHSVQQSGSFRRDLLGRARRTFTSSYALVFGDLSTAVRSAQRMYAIHSHIAGVVEPHVPTAWAGRSYCANDPQLLLWVWATLVDTARLTYETLIRPLTQAEKEAHYQDARYTALLTGVPATSIPPTLDDFSAYVQTMLTSEELAVTEVTTDLTQLIFDAPYIKMTKLDEIITAGFLPERFRPLCGVQWDASHQRYFHRVVATLRCLHKTLPFQLRAVPAYRQAKGRIAQARGQHSWMC